MGSEMEIESHVWPRWDTLQAQEATAKDVEGYIQRKLNDYVEIDLSGTELYEEWKADFINFTASTFSKNRESTKNLRNFLRKNGVYIRKSRKPIAGELANALHNPEEWPEQDKERPAWIQLRQSTPTSPHKDTLDQDDQQDESTGNERESSNNRGEQTSRVRESGNGNSNYILINLAKLYTDEQKYSGDNDTFDYKYGIFLSHCERTNVPREAYLKAFPTMLKGSALNYYYTSCNLNPRISSLTELCENIRSYFEGPEHERNMLLKWNATSLRSVITKDPGKSIEESLQILVQELRDLQHGLEKDLRHESFFLNKLLIACQDHPACSLACARPGSTVTGFINDLRSSIITYEKVKNYNQSPAQFQLQTDNYENQDQDQYFTDRRYYSNPRQQNRPQRFDHRNQSNSRNDNRDRVKKCFVCNKPGCWSNRHSQEERNKARDRYKVQLDRRFNHRFDQYVADIEGKDEGEGENLMDEFEALIIDSESPPQPTLNHAFITELGMIDPPTATSMISTLLDQSVKHVLFTGLGKTEAGEDADLSPAFTIEDRYSDTEFHGIMIDTGAAGKSTAGHGQFLAYKQLFKSAIRIDKSKEGAMNATFGIGSTTSIGSVTIPTPIGDIGFYVVQANTPFLFSLADMDKKGIILDNLQNKLIHNEGSRSTPIVRRFGHPFLMWGPMISSNRSYLTESELRTLHRRFGHPSASRLLRVLERAGHEDPHHRQLLNRISKLCSRCQKFDEAPSRFKFTLRDNDIDFNHSIFIDIMYLDGSPVLHVVDEATRFQAARWLPSMAAQHVWESLRICWIDVYLGPPDLINHDAGTNFTSNEFQQYANSLAIITNEVPVEAAHSIGIVERYHKPLRRAYTVIMDEFKENGNITMWNKALILQMAVKAINDTAGPDGITPTLLVFGAFPRMSELNPPAPSIAQRATAIKKAMAEITKLRATRQVNDALRTRNGPRTENLHSLPLGSDVLVWRIHHKEWEGPYKLLSVCGETATLELPNGPTQFRTTSVKPYSPTQGPIHERESTQEREELQPQPPTEGESPTQPTTEDPHAENPRRNPPRNRRLPSRYNVVDLSIFLSDHDPPQPDYTHSRQIELNGLLERGVFELTTADEVPYGARIFNSRFVDLIKHAGTSKAMEKSRLVVQAYKDADKKGVLTQAPTIQRASQRLILSLAASTHGLEVYMRDISQAYTQSETNLARDFFVRPPKEMNLPDGLLLKVLRPLYGVPEAGTHWFRTYHNHHISRLGMKQSSYDPCLLFTSNDSTQGQGIVGLQTDDTLIVCDSKFKDKESVELKNAGFLAKPREQLTTDHPIMFNGVLVTKETSPPVITITQSKQIQKIMPIPLDSITREKYVAQRARGAYVSSVCHPQVAFGLSHAAQSTDPIPSKDDVNQLNKCLQWQLENHSKGLKFVKLDVDKLKIVVFTDSSFANNKDHSSQIGFVTVLADDEQCNLIHWSSVKCRRITRSVIASELYAMGHGFDSACVLKDTLDNILNKDGKGKGIPLIICIDSFSLYECLVKLGTTHEKRLMIDLMCIRQAYERREIAEVRWIQGDKNPADPLTKHKGNKALDVIIETNKIDIEASGWVER